MGDTPAEESGGVFFWGGDWMRAHAGGEGRQACAVSLSAHAGFLRHGRQLVQGQRARATPPSRGADFWHNFASSAPNGFLMRSSAKPNAGAGIEKPPRNPCCAPNIHQL